MPAITLSAKQVQQLVNTGEDSFYIAKDHGAYVGAGQSDKGGVCFYFRGCDPTKGGDDWYHTCRDKFGGDDFGDTLPMESMKKLLVDGLLVKIKIDITPTQIKTYVTRRRPAAV